MSGKCAHQHLLLWPFDNAVLIMTSNLCKIMCVTLFKGHDPGIRHNWMRVEGGIIRKIHALVQNYLSGFSLSKRIGKVQYVYTYTYKTYCWYVV
jgi:hypothetical protein